MKVYRVWQMREDKVHISLLALPEGKVLEPVEVPGPAGRRHVVYRVPPGTLYVYEATYTWEKGSPGKLTVIMYRVAGNRLIPLETVVVTVKTRKPLPLEELKKILGLASLAHTFGISMGRTVEEYVHSISAYA